MHVAHWILVGCYKISECRVKGGHFKYIVSQTTELSISRSFNLKFVKDLALSQMKTGVLPLMLIKTFLKKNDFNEILHSDRMRSPKLKRRQRESWQLMQRSPGHKRIGNLRNSLTTRKPYKEQLFANCLILHRWQQ